MTRRPVQIIEPVCMECQKMAVLTTGREVYPDHEHLWDKPIYRCACGAYVGCHPGTEVPLGYPAGPHTRRARMKAHEAFDPLWRRKATKEGISRSKARGLGYKWLAEQLGLDPSVTHISYFDAATCQKVVALCMRGNR